MPTILPFAHLRVLQFEMFANTLLRSFPRQFSSLYRFNALMSIGGAGWLVQDYLVQVNRNAREPKKVSSICYW